jgi:hypothetical protein
MDMNMVEFEGKKVMIRPSQAQSTKGKGVVIGEERQLRMIKPKSLEAGQWKKKDRRKPQSCPKTTFNILMAKSKKAESILGREKTGPSSFPRSCQYFCRWKFVQQSI